MRLKLTLAVAFLAALVSRVKFKPFLFGTALGVVPFTLLMTLFGAQVSALFWRLLA